MLGFIRLLGADGGSGEQQLGGDIYEVAPDKTIVWEWHAHRHLDLNRFSSVTPEGDWLHMNSIAPLPENKWYDAGDQRFRLAHGHEPEMIEKGLPGAGNIIMFDNGLFPRHRTHSGQSFIIELNPVTEEIVWEYVNRGGTTRPFPVAYDYCPRLRALPRSSECAVTPPNNLEWHIEPDVFRGQE